MTAVIIALANITLLRALGEIREALRDVAEEVRLGPEEDEPEDHFALAFPGERRPE